MDPGERMERLEDEVKRLTQLLNEQSIRLQASPRASAGQKHFRKPPEFDGKDRTQCDAFLMHLDLYLGAHNQDFPDDPSKVRFAATYLRGRAFNWIQPYLKSYESKGKD